MIDKFKEIPTTEHGLKLYITHASREMKAMDAKKKKLENNIQECHRRMGEHNVNAINETP